MRQGTRISLRTLATAAMTISANDAAAAIGEALAGKGNSIADMMNAQARTLGMLGTRFIDATGQDILPPYPARQNISTARDIATLAGRLYGAYGKKYSAILHPEAMSFGGRRMTNIEKDVINSREGDLGNVVLAKGGINVGGHDSAVVMTPGPQSGTYVMVILGAQNTPALKAERGSVLRQAEIAVAQAEKQAALSHMAQAIGPRVHPVSVVTQRR
jgi:D-alanyl-D-alanine carboxypeptidase